MDALFPPVLAEEETNTNEVQAEAVLPNPIPEAPEPVIQAAEEAPPVEADPPPSKPSIFDFSLVDTAKIGAAIAGRIMRPDIAEDNTERTFKGLGNRDILPNPEHVEVLRKNQRDPLAVQAYEYKYGAGSAERYLNYAKKEHIDKLIENKDDPVAVAAFNALYGQDMAKIYVPLYDSRTSAADKLVAAQTLRRIIYEGTSVTDTLANSRVGEVIGSVSGGMEQAGGELVQSGVSGIKIIGSPVLTDGANAALDSFSESRQRPDTRQLDMPVVSGLTRGVSQFLTAFAVTKNLVPQGAGLPGMAAWTRTATAGALADAFGFDPKDPLLGDLGRSVVEYFGVDPETAKEYIYSVEGMSEGEARAVRALEGAGVGLVVEAFLKLVGLTGRAAKLAEAGDEAGSKAATDEAADIMDDLAAQEAKQASEEATAPSQASPVSERMISLDDAHKAQFEFEVGILDDLIAKGKVDGEDVSYYETLLKSRKDSINNGTVSESQLLSDIENLELTNSAFFSEADATRVKDYKAKLDEARASQPEPVDPVVEAAQSGIDNAAVPPAAAAVAPPASTVDPDITAYNKKIRTPETGVSLNRDNISNLNDNILYRPDRGYRFIGKEGYDDFIASGEVRAREGSKQAYSKPYFMQGKTSSRYAGNGGDQYVVEAVTTSKWELNNKYIGPGEKLTKSDRIRVYEKQADGSYKVVYDNIGDEALMPSTTATTTPPTRLPDTPAFDPVVAGAAKLPKDLVGAKPRYAMGDKKFTLTFDSDIEKALYITAQNKRSPRDADYRAWLQKQGYTDAEIHILGKQVKDGIKLQAKDAKTGGNLKVGSVATRKQAAPAVDPVVQAAKAGIDNAVSRLPDTPAFDPVAAERQTADESILAAVDDTPAEVKAVKEAIEGSPSKTAPDNPLQALLRDTPDLVDDTFREAEAAVRPRVDAFIAAVKDAPEQALRQLEELGSIQDVKKFGLYAKAAASRYAREIDDLKMRIDGLLDSGQGADADVILTTSLPKATAAKEAFDKLDAPLSRLAAVMLVTRKIEWDSVNAAGNRVRIAKLKEQGFTPYQIAAEIAAALRKKKVNTTKLEKLVEKARAAKEKVDAKALAATNKAIEKEMAKLTADAKLTIPQMLYKALETAVAVKLNALLSGVNTMFIVNLVSSTMNLTLRTASEFVGTALTRGVKDAMAVTGAKLIGLRAGQRSGLAAARYIIGQTLKAAKEDTSFISAEGQNASDALARTVSAANYNLDPSKLTGKTVDVVGKYLVHVPSTIMQFGDELLGNINSRMDIGAEAMLRFLDHVAGRKKELTAILKDPNLSAARREALGKELADLKKSPTITVGNRTFTKTEYIDESIRDAFDENGKLIDVSIQKQSDETLLKNPFENKKMRAAESLLTHPIARLMVLPFFRTPFRAMQAGFELVPGLNQLISPNFRNDLRGVNGARRQQIAHGKQVIGYTLATTAFGMMLEGRITGSGPQSAGERRAWTDGGWPGPNKINLSPTMSPDGWFDISSMEPFATNFKIMANIGQTFAMYELRDKDIGKAGEIITAVALAMSQSITDNTMLTGLKSAADLAGLAEAKDSQTDDRLNRFAVTQLKSFIPRLLVNINNTFDPRLTQDLSLIDGLNSSLGNKDEAPKQYDYRGQVRTNANPMRAWFGVFSSVDAKSRTPMTFAGEQIKTLSMITGASFDLSPLAPDSRRTDLRKFDSMTGKGKVSDRLYENFARIKIDGFSFDEALYALLKNKDLNLSAGNEKKNGTLTEAVKELQTKYLKGAWSFTEAAEFSAKNTALRSDIMKNKKIDQDAGDKSLDRSPGKLLMQSIIK